MSEVENTDVQETQPATEAEGLNVTDLQSLRAIVDIATARGAFKANELEAVGKTYNKLNSFLEQIAKQASESAGE